MANTKYFMKKGPKMAEFPFIFVRNLKWVATGLEWWENCLFFVTPQVYAHPWLAVHTDFQKKKIQDTLVYINDWRLRG